MVMSILSAFHIVKYFQIGMTRGMLQSTNFTIYHQDSTNCLHLGFKYDNLEILMSWFCTHESVTINSEFCWFMMFLLKIFPFLLFI